MKKLINLSVVAIIAFGLSACATKQQTGLLVGSTAGALIGGSLTSGGGQVLGIVGGAALGGLLGSSIGKIMDNQDKMLMQRSLTQTRVGQKARWRNANSGNEFEIVPVKNYHQRGRYCREFQTIITVDGKKQRAYGHACRQPDGSWKIINQKS